jgi:hypothetical protein
LFDEIRSNFIFLKSTQEWEQERKRNKEQGPKCRQAKKELQRGEPHQGKGTTKCAKTSTSLYESISTKERGLGLFWFSFY